MLQFKVIIILKIKLYVGVNLFPETCTPNKNKTIGTFFVLLGILNNYSRVGSYLCYFQCQ